MRRLFFLALFISFFQAQSFAWDEVTHAYMTGKIPHIVKNEPLKQLLQENSDEFVYGSWFTDTYQYTNHRINGLNPHIISEYAPGFFNYLQLEDVKKQDNYEKLVALYLGSLAHLLEDFWYDSNLNKYQKTKADKFIGDSKHGAFVAKQHDYINLKVKRFFPADDLFEMYKNAGMLREGFDSKDKFENRMDQWSNQQYLMLRSLKLLNFLGGNQMHNQSLWTAGNLKTIGGGMTNCTEVAARFIEEEWKRLNGKATTLFIHADYFYYANKIAVIASSPLQENDFSNVILMNSKGDLIPGKVKRFVHPDKKKGITQYAFAFYPEQPLITNQSYKLIVQNSVETFEHEFTNMGNTEVLAERKPFFQTLGMGIFGLIPMLALGGIFIGIAGLSCFMWSGKNSSVQMPKSRKLLNTLLNSIGIITIGFGIFLLLTRGSLIIAMAI